MSNKNTKRLELVGKVQTVLGPTSPESVGVTLRHEHLLCDLVEPLKEVKRTEATGEWFYNHPVTPEIRWWLTYHQNSNRDN